MPERTFTDPDTWFAGLPGVVIAAGGLITDPAGQVLLVKPNYRERWALPGGICELGEPPQTGCGRELAEELGLDIPVGRLLATDWSQPYGTDARAIMHFVFDGGQLADGSGIVHPGGRARRLSFHLGGRPACLPARLRAGQGYRGDPRAGVGPEHLPAARRDLTASRAGRGPGQRTGLASKSWTLTARLVRLAPSTSAS